MVTNLIELKAHLEILVAASEENLCYLLSIIQQSPVTLKTPAEYAYKAKPYTPAFLVHADFAERLPHTIGAVLQLTTRGKEYLKNPSHSELCTDLVNFWQGDLADWLFNIKFQMGENGAEFLFDLDNRTEYLLCPYSGIFGLELLEATELASIVRKEEVTGHWLKPPHERASYSLTVSLTKAGEKIYQELEEIKEYRDQFKEYLGFWVCGAGLLESFPEPRDFPMPKNCPPEVKQIFAEANARRREQAKRIKEEGREHYRSLHAKFPHLLPPPDELYRSIALHRSV